MSRPESPAPLEPAPSPPPDAKGGVWRAPASPWNASLLAALFAILIVSGFALYLILQVRAAERMIAVETGVTQTPGVLRLQAPSRRWPTDFTQEVLEDSAGTLVLADVLSPEYRDRFAPWPNGAVRTRFTRSALWVRLQVRNVSVLPDDFLLQYDRANTDSVILFRSLDDGPFVRVETGALLPFAAREVAHPEYIFHITLAPRQKADLYLRVQSRSLLATSLTLWTEAGFATYDGLRRFVWGAYYGVLLAIAFFHFFLYLSLRERPYLWLVVWTIGIIFLFSTVDGRAHRFFWPQGGAATAWATPVAMAWVLAGMIAFASTFLQTAQRAPVLHRVMNGLVVLVALSLLLTPVVSKAALSLFQYALLLPIVVTVMLAAWAALRDGYKPALIFLVAMLLPLVLGIYDLAMVFLGSTQRQISREGEGLIAVLFITVLTLALDDRINDLRRDRETTLRELRHSERRLEQYMDAMPMAIDVRNTDGALTFWNSSVMAEMSTRG
ncbi:MAG: 7TMR-DISM family protein, partial [Caldilineaceae bacterium]